MTVNNFLLGEKGNALLSEFEGTRLKMYICPSGHPTIGIGHKLTSQEIKTGIIVIKGKSHFWTHGLTSELVELLCDQDTDYFESLVNRHVLAPINQNQFDALVCFTFNIPVASFLSSTLLKKLNAKHYSEVPTQLKRWVYAYDPQIKKRVKLSGLVRRRNAEAELWEGLA